MKLWVRSNRAPRGAAGPLPKLVLPLLVALAGCGGERLDGNARIAESLGEGDAPVATFVTDDTLHLQEAVVKFYRDRGYRPAWTDDDEILPRGEVMLEALRLAEEDGLDPERYHYSTVARLAEILEKDDVDGVDDGREELRYLGDLDVILTEGFYRYARDLVHGTIDPEQANLEWHIPKLDPPDETLIHRVLEGADPAETLRSLRPPAPYYGRMMQALARYRKIAEQGGWPEVPEAEIEETERSPAVARLRARLIAENDPVEAPLARSGEATADVFDADLKRALEHFQDRHALEQDGRLGLATLAALNVPVEERVLALQLNLERWRWLPRELGDLYILVNIAGFDLEVVENDRPILSMPVVVGQEAWQTPIFQDTMKYLVVNPYWNVPPSIQADEILPAVQRDPGYLTRNDFEVVDRSGSTARVVSAEEIDWSSVDAEGFPYSFRQRPGDSNALGKLKFMLPNHHNIYLHDTPAGHLFSESQRAFSHGCIRVAEPERLANLLLEKVTDTPPSRLHELIASGEEKHVQFNQGVPVHILYFTAWADENGSVGFYPDTYGQDRKLEGETERKLAGPPVPGPTRGAT